MSDSVIIPAFDAPNFPDDNLDIAITRPRYDIDDTPQAALETPKGTSLCEGNGRAEARPESLRADGAPGRGPRQRRFDFDSKVIRDTIVTKLRSIGRDDIARPIDGCHREAHYRKCTGCGDVRTFFNRCERFYCPICAGRLARDRRETVAFWKNEVAQPKHVVLTVKSVPVLTKAWIRQLKADFRKLRSMKWAKEGEFLWRATDLRIATAKRSERPVAVLTLPDGSTRGVQPVAEPLPGIKRRNRKLSPWKGRKMGNRTSIWRGGFWSLDATWHRDIEPGQTYECNGDQFTADAPIERGWHIHFHAIVDADFIDREKLETEWCKIRGQSMAIVRVYDVRGKDYVAEACKYVCDGVQVGNWPAEKLAEFADALGDERCFDTFGVLYKRRAEWTAAKELIHEDRNVCACGCRDFRHFDEGEWEWQCTVSGVAPPGADKVARPRFHPELFAPVCTVVK